jgi:hypothetical protein
MKKRKTIQLPTDCLSYSQVSLWLSSPERYKEIFFEHNDSARFMNEGMAYGKIVADALENEEETGDLLTDMAMSFVGKIRYTRSDNGGSAENKGWGHPYS